jgi:sterol desaturase/sphingolipid hydroxylase (fatty acid hydroxylase superfamily)
MDWLTGVGTNCLTTLGWLAGLAVAFSILARLTPCNPGMHWWRDLRAVCTDCVYWFAVPLVLRVCRVVLLVAGIVLIFGGQAPHALPLQGLALWQQCLAILVFQDVLLYAMHRFFHTRLGWKIHAVHHSPKLLDWMSSARIHPVNHLLTFTLVDVAVVLVGFSPAALVALIPFNTVYSALVHANLNWTFGPLRYVLASPVFHRWHHTSVKEGGDRNFASTFPLLDLAFGTFYMPPGKRPEHFGNGDPEFPEAFWGQVLYPFRKKGAQTARGQTLTRLRRAAVRIAVAGFAAFGLLAAAAYFVAWRAGPDQPPDETAMPDVQQLRAEMARHATPRAFLLRVAISADGRRIVAGSADGTVKVWDPAGGGPALTLTGHSGPVYAVAVSSDGRWIVSGGYDKTVKVWDAATGREQLTFRGHQAAVLTVAVSGDGRRVVSGSADLAAKVWDGSTGREEFGLALDCGAVPCVALSADGRYLVAAGAGEVRVWDATTGRPRRTLPADQGGVCCVAVSGDGGRIITGGWGPVTVWDAATGRQEFTLAGHAGPVYCVAVSPDGRHVVSGGKDRTVKVWDAATGRQEFTLNGPADFVTSVAVSTGGPCVVAGSRDGTMKVWDVSGPGLAVAPSAGR